MCSVMNSPAVAPFVSRSLQFDITTRRSISKPSATLSHSVHLRHFREHKSSSHQGRYTRGAALSFPSCSSADPSAFKKAYRHVFLNTCQWRQPITCAVRPTKFAIATTPVGSGDKTLPQGSTEVDAHYMRMCVDLAKEAVGKTSPNPIVGCVIVKDGKIVGRGFHPKAGEPHAEVFALREAGSLAEGATAYVSLEPCNHHGRTPPCSQALLRAKLRRVVVGVVDPNPQVAGKGIKVLCNAGIDVVVGVEEALCRKTNEVFMHRMKTSQPFVTLRYSMSMDGGFLGGVGVNNVQGGLYSKLLQENDAVVITDAAVFDDPVLLSLEPGAKQPLRVILARSLNLPLESKVFDTTSAKTLVLVDQSASVDSIQSKSADVKLMEDRLRARGVEVVMMKDLNLDHVSSVCYQRGAISVLLDSRGPDFSGLENFLGQQAMQEEVPQKIVVQVAPIFLGEHRTDPGFRLDTNLVKLERVSTYMVGQDVVLEGYFPQT